jgi:hypothetical protein
MCSLRLLLSKVSVANVCLMLRLLLSKVSVANVFLICC